MRVLPFLMDNDKLGDMEQKAGVELNWLGLLLLLHGRMWVDIPMAISYVIPQSWQLG